MGCKKLHITDYFRLTPTTSNPNLSIPASPDTSEKSPRGFKPVIPVSISNYRYYSCQVGKWLSRDPIMEDGGYNLYGMVSNDPVGRWDYLGKEKLVDWRTGEYIFKPVGKLNILDAKTEEMARSQKVKLLSAYFYSIDKNDNCCYEYPSYADWVQVWNRTVRKYSRKVFLIDNGGADPTIGMFNEMLNGNPSVDTAMAAGQAPWMYSKGGVVGQIPGIGANIAARISQALNKRYFTYTATWSGEEIKVDFKRVSPYRIATLERRRVSDDYCAGQVPRGEPIAIDFERAARWKIKDVLRQNGSVYDEDGTDFKEIYDSDEINKYLNPVKDQLKP